MTPLRAKMIRAMQLQRLAPRTPEASMAAVVGLITFDRCAPNRLSPEQIHTSVHPLLVERHLAWSSCHHVACGLQCFSPRTLGWDPLQRNLPPRTGRSPLPHVLSAEERQRLFTSARHPKHRALLMTTSAAGLRVSEVVHLQLPDIASDRRLLRVHQGKGRQDRSTLLSPRLLAALRASWTLARPPQWVCPGQDLTQPMPIGTAQRISSHAKQAANLSHGQGIHTLRHGFATHRLAAGVDPRTLQLLLGHRSLHTTTRSLRVSRTHLANIRRPCDLLRVDTLPPPPEEEGHGSDTHQRPPSREDGGLRTPPWEVADLFRLSGEASRAASPMPPSAHKVMHDMTVCRTAQLGGHTAQCAHCGFARYASHSCRNRHCPTCQTLTKAQWGADRQAELLPVPSFHCVCTPPHALNPLVLGHTRPLRTLRCTAVRQTLLQCGHHNLGGQSGGTMVLHTWDQTLGAHVHLHCLIPAGALSPDGAQWLPTHPRLLFPVQALRTVFRGTCLDAFHHMESAGTLPCPEETSDVSPPERCALLPEPLDATDWGVYVTPAFAGPAQTLDDLGRSTPRVALSTNRIVEVRDGQVRFTSRNRRQGNQVQTMVLEAPECIRRFLLPVVPQGLQRMRPSGFLANRGKARALRQCRHLLGQSADPPARCTKTVGEWMRQCTGTDITRCPSCGYGPLQRTPLPALLLHPGRPLPLRILDSS